MSGQSEPPSLKPLAQYVGGFIIGIISIVLPIFCVVGNARPEDKVGYTLNVQVFGQKRGDILASSTALKSKTHNTIPNG